MNIQRLSTYVLSHPTNCVCYSVCVCVLQCVCVCYSMQLAVDVSIPELFGGVGGEAVYIGTPCIQLVARVTIYNTALVVY